jgi:hypothetical protein
MLYGGSSEADETGMLMKTKQSCSISYVLVSGMQAQAAHQGGNV